MIPAIPMRIEATKENFEESSYLASNPDVAAAVGNGIFASGLAHFQQVGMSEHRGMRLPENRLLDARKAKMKKVAALLDTSMPHEVRGDKLDFLTQELRDATRIIDTVNVSSNGYDSHTTAMIDRCSDGIVLDCGSGRRGDYYANVVNYEIANYDTTDIIGVGERLPFKDNSFDAVISIAVLEHVRDPFLCASEISRVLKPGGELYCSVPFLQPYHGYPHHYFNATKQGIRRLFEDQLTVTGVSVPVVGHPAFTLHWFLSSWLRGVPAETQEKFAATTIGDLVKIDPHNIAGLYAFGMKPTTVEELACSFVLEASKS
ncbi:class I SAM-dependent methyltransferase [Rhizobium sp. LjRoot98]|uniref:methyltransferase domain-containing protein n=1 Tax=Rhizobium sp. LjRoot98 TaxID=3342345 RepID=UPI003ECCE4CD